MGLQSLGKILHLGGVKGIAHNKIAAKVKQVLFLFIHFSSLSSRFFSSFHFFSLLLPALKALARNDARRAT